MFSQRWIIVICGMLGGCATSDERCAFMNTRSNECVVEYQCTRGDERLCETVVTHLQKRVAQGLPTVERRKLGAVCDDSPILCTCCDVDQGCYPCPKE